MPIRRNLPHLVVPARGVAEPFQPKGAGGATAAPSHVPDREAHAQALIQQLAPIVNAAEQSARRDDLPRHETGVYVEVVSRPGEPLATDSLERGDIELLAVRTDRQTTRATLFVPATSKDKLSRVVESYRTKTDSRSKAGDPLYRRLVEGIAEFKLAYLRDLWADDDANFPAEGVEAAWETWLRGGTEARFRAFAERLGVAVGPSGLAFPESSAVKVILPRFSGHPC